MIIMAIIIIIKMMWAIFLSRCTLWNTDLTSAKMSHVGAIFRLEYLETDKIWISEYNENRKADVKDKEYEWLGSNFYGENWDCRVTKGIALLWLGLSCFSSKFLGLKT